MTRLNDKLLVVGFLLVAAITACVNMPETAPEAVAVQDAAPAAPSLAPTQPVVSAPQSVLVPQAPVPTVPQAEPVPSQPVTVMNTTASEAVSEAMPSLGLPGEVEVLCDQIGNKLSSVSVEDCLQQSFRFGGGFSINQRPLVIKELPPFSDRDDHFRVLLLGGIHGDEYSSISIIFKWLELFSHNAQEGDFHWRIAPLANPDGLLDGRNAQRQNANGVDLNRNFPSGDWNDKAAQYWLANTGSNPRRFPGEAPASEPEVQWIVDQIEDFNPDVIISVHAPYHLLDFDGPAEAPQRIGELYLHQLGVYPGSLGNYAGLDKQIPVVTLELPSAGILPNEEQIRVMWRDLVVWLDTTGRKNLASRY